MEFLRCGYLEVWVPGVCVPLVRFADRVRSIASTGVDLVGVVPGASVNFSGFDEIWSWYGTGRPEFRDAVAGLPFRFFPALPGGRPAVDFYCAQVGAPVGAVPRIDCLRRDAGFLAVHPFSGSACKNWPLEGFREMANASGLPVRWLAGEGEVLAGAERFDDLYELGCWLATARAYLGNDSGITHLAAAVGVPVTAVFLTSDPRIWAPRGSGGVTILRM